MATVRPIEIEGPSMVGPDIYKVFPLYSSLVVLGPLRSDTKNLVVRRNLNRVSRWAKTQIVGSTHVD